MSEAQMFRVPLAQVEGRLDPHFYQPSTVMLLKRLQESAHPKKKLSELLVHRCTGDWGEDEDQVDSDEQYQRCLVLRSTEFENDANLRLNGERRKYRKILKTKLNRMRVEENDILIEKSGGSPDQPVGRVAYLTTDVLAHDWLAYSNFIEKIKPDKNLVEPEYLFHYLRMLHSIGITNRLQSQTNGIRNLMMADYLKLPICLPSTGEQLKIAALMRDAHAQKTRLESEAKDLLESVDAVLYQHLGIEPAPIKADSLNERVFKTLMSQVVGRFDPYANRPEVRQWLHMVKQGHYTSSPLHKLVHFKKEIVNLIPEGMRYIGLENINGSDGMHTETTEKFEINSALFFKAGDILFSKLRPNLNKTHMAMTNGVCSTEFHVLQVNNISVNYLTAYLRCGMVVSLLAQLVTGNTLPRLQTEDVLRLPVITPPLHIQQKIATEIEAIKNQTQALRQQAQMCLDHAKQQVEQMILGESL
jgi:restriction endonuclease S subunit